MMSRHHLVARVALFSALVYVLSWGTSFLPNINFIFFIVFSAGLMWGALPGALVGLFGMGLWTALNPYGPAPVPIMVAQVLGAAGSGLVGVVFRTFLRRQCRGPAMVGRLVPAAILCTVIFYLPVNIVDAALFQPFWPRFVGGAIWAGISMVSNVLIFPLLFSAARRLYVREGVIGES
ncbi:MAG: hypothetical protein ABII79_05095 [bacterium]